MSAKAGTPVTAAAAARLVRGVLRAEGVRRAMVSVAFVGRRRIRALNRRHLHHDRDTDVIAFTLTDAPAPGRSGARKAASRPPLATLRLATGLVCDIYVCVPVAAAQARRFGVSAREEVRRLVVHGVLHVLGYDHAADASRTAGPMWRRQERLLRRLAGRR